MAILREESLNSILTLPLDQYDSIHVDPERRDAGASMDIRVVRAGAADNIPNFAEAKTGDTPSKRRKAAKQARPQLRFEPRAHVFALCYPSQLRN